MEIMFKSKKVLLSTYRERLQYELLLSWAYFKADSSHKTKMILQCLPLMYLSGRY